MLTGVFGKIRAALLTQLKGPRGSRPRQAPHERRDRLLQRRHARLEVRILRLRGSSRSRPPARPVSSATGSTAGGASARAAPPPPPLPMEAAARPCLIARRAPTRARRSSRARPIGLYRRPGRGSTGARSRRHTTRPSALFGEAAAAVASRARPRSSLRNARRASRACHLRRRRSGPTSTEAAAAAAAAAAARARASVRRRAVPPGLCACASRKPPQSPCVVGTKGWRLLGGAARRRCCGGPPC